MTITLNLTEEQAMEIRRAMCNASMKALTKAFDTEEELRALGRTDRDMVDFYMGVREMDQQIIKMIDKEMKGEA